MQRNHAECGTASRGCFIPSSPQPPKPGIGGWQLHQNADGRAMATDRNEPGFGWGVMKRKFTVRAKHAST